MATPVVSVERSTIANETNTTTGVTSLLVPVSQKKKKKGKLESPRTDNRTYHVPGVLSRNALSYQECSQDASPYLNSFYGVLVSLSFIIQRIEDGPRGERLGGAHL